MGNNVAFFLLITVSIVIGACGFKSDLFLPGEPENAGQLDSNSIETIKQRSLDNLQQDDLQVIESQIRGVTDEISGTDGVPVIIEPLSDDKTEEIKKNRDKNKIP